MHGTTSVEIVIDTQKENGWADPIKLKKLDALSKKIASYEDSYISVGKVISLADIVKETNKALHANNEAFYTIPDEKNLVAQELLLFENSGSDDLEDVVDSQFSKIRMTIRVPWVDAMEAKGFMKFIQTQATQTFPHEDVVVTGMVPLLINTFSNAVYSAIKSYLIAGVLIGFMMMLILGSLRLGLLSMIPNIILVIAGLFLMYLAFMALDIFTLLIGSVAIGMAVDDTIHFMHNFKRYYKSHGDSQKAIEQTFYTTGKAMLITSIVLASGFLTYAISSMHSIQNFGILTAFIILFALVADLLLAPALMVFVVKRGWMK